MKKITLSLFSLFCLLILNGFILKGALTEAIPVAHMAVVYAKDAELSNDNYEVGTNPVIPNNIDSMIASQSTPILMNGSLASIYLHFINSHDTKSFDSRGLRVIRRSIKNLKPKEWKFYRILKPEPFVLFVPKKYLETHKESGLNTENLIEFKSEDIKSVIEKLKAEPKPKNKTAEAILKFFNPYDQKNPITWNIVLFGHGMTSVKAGFTPAQLILKKTGVIAGLPSKQFINLVEMWSDTIKPKVILWITCFGGGLNAEALQQILAIAKRFKVLNQGVLLSVAQTDEPIAAEDLPNYKDAFALLDTIPSNLNLITDKDEKDKMEKSIIKTSIQAISSLGFTRDANKGLIFMPDKGNFQLLSEEKTDMAITISHEEFTYTIKGDLIEEPLNLPDRLAKRVQIKLGAGGELAEQTIDTIKSGSFENLIVSSILDANKMNAFFKILNIKKLCCKISNKKIRKALSMDTDPSTFEVTLYNVKIILFPEGLSCRGYIVASIRGKNPKEEYPLTISVWKYIKNIQNLVHVQTYENIKNQTQFDTKMQKIQKQVISNGLLEKFFTGTPNEFKNESFADDAIELTEKKITSANKFIKIMNKYNLHMHPNKEGIQNILMDIANDCKNGKATLDSIKNKKIILDQIEKLNPKMLDLLEDSCPEIIPKKLITPKI